MKFDYKVYFAVELAEILIFNLSFIGNCFIEFNLACILFFLSSYLFLNLCWKMATLSTRIYQKKILVWHQPEIPTYTLPMYFVCNFDVHTY